MVKSTGLCWCYGRIWNDLGLTLAQVHTAVHWNVDLHFVIQTSDFNLTRKKLPKRIVDDKLKLVKTGWHKQLFQLFDVFSENRRFDAAKKRRIRKGSIPTSSIAVIIRRMGMILSTVSADAIQTFQSLLKIFWPQKKRRWSSLVLGNK